MTIVVQCTNGFDRRNKRDCTYEVRYTRIAESVVNTLRRIEGFHCPNCGKYPLRVCKVKEPAVKP